MATTHGRRSFRLGSARTVGLALSAITALGAVGLVAFFYLRGLKAAPVKAKEKPIAASEAPPDIRAMSAGQPLGAGKGMRVTLVDKRDPSRTSMEILSERTEPQPDARYEVEKPQAFIYSRNGTIWHIRSDTGRLYIPNTQGQPEAATLQGNVIIRAFDAPPPGQRLDPDSKDASPLVTIRTNAIDYDAATGEVKGEDWISLASDRAMFKGFAFRAIYNQERNRVEYAEIVRDSELRYSVRGNELSGSRKAKEPSTASAQASPASATTSTTTTSPTTTPGLETATPRLPIDTFYHATLSGGVELTRGGQRIDSDALEGWAHLLDNELPENAVTPTKVRVVSDSSSATTDSPTIASTDEQLATDPPTQDVASQDSSPTKDVPVVASRENARDSSAATDSDSTPINTSAAGADDEIVLRWKGSMVLRAVEEKPETLVKDFVAVRFTTGPDQVCTFNDASSGAQAVATVIQYGATSQELGLASLTPDGVRLTARGSGSAIATDMTVNLGTGVTRVRGPGTLRDDRVWTASADAPHRTSSDPISIAADDRSISWSGGAEFQFRVNDGGMTSMVETASASGQVEAVQGDARLRGETMTAGFLIRDERSDLYKLVLRDGAIASDGKGGALSSDSLDVTFDALDDEGSPMPRVIVALGDVKAQSAGTALLSEILQVNLGTDENGDMAVTTVNARQGATFTRAEEKDDGRVSYVRAAADEIDADAQAQLVELHGTAESPATISNATSRVSGGQISIDGVRRHVTIFGAGRFDHTGGSTDSAATSDAAVTWSRSISYDDIAGTVECEGNVVASNSPDAFTTQTLRAHRARLVLEPLPEGVAPDPEAPPRRLLQAHAWGSAGTGDGASPAQVEMRVYATPFGAGRERPVRVAFLEGDYVLADDAAGMLRVPGAGRMFFSDRRRNDDVPADERSQTTALQDMNRGAFKRGDARFAWNDSMEVDRRMGVATITGKANMRHVRLADGLPTDIEADRLVGRFRDIHVSESDRPDANLRAEFLGADAAGNVWIRTTDNKELIADLVEYDAEASIANAAANEGSEVVYFDPTTGVPQRARRLLWHQVQNRIEIIQPSTIVLPR